MITFEMLLKMPTLKPLDVVAGQDGLNREISVISVMDAPDSYKWLKGGEFILTSAYLSGGDSKFLELDLINLIEANSSSLGIKKDRYLKEIPPNIVLLANKYQFPVIEIPYHFRWSDIIAVYYELLHSITENTYAIVEPEQIEQIYSAGRKSAVQLMDRLTEIYKMPMAVVLNDKKIQADNNLPGAKLICGALENTILFPENMSDEVLSVGKYFMSVYFIPFYRQGYMEYLAIMSQNKGFFKEIHKLFRVLANLGEHENIKVNDNAQIYRKFMLNIISGKTTPEEIIYFENYRGAEKKIYTGILIIHSTEVTAVYHKILDTLKNPRLIKKGSTSSYIVNDESKHEAVVMLEFHAKDNNDDSQNEWQRIFFEDMEYCMYELHKGSISVGRFYLRLEDALSSYSEAKEAYAIGKIVWDERYCYLYSILSVYSALNNTNREKIDISYIEILEHNENGFSFDGLSTLEAYIECDSQKKTAEKLFIHENTLRYRMQKIGDFLHLDLNDPIVINSLITQIKLYKLIRIDIQH